MPFQISSVQIVQAYIDRIKEVNPLINAVVQDRFEAAIEEAKHADFVAGTTSLSTLQKSFPILGVPFTVKESCKVSGKQNMRKSLVLIVITFTTNLRTLRSVVFFDFF